MKNSRFQIPRTGETPNSRVQSSKSRPVTNMKIRFLILQSFRRIAPHSAVNAKLTLKFAPSKVLQCFGLRQSSVAMASTIMAIFNLTMFTPFIGNAATSGKIFARPEDAVAELRTATSTANPDALRELFGPAAENLQNPDRVQATNDLETFHAALMTTNHLKRASDTNILIEVGLDSWPFPIPLVKEGGGWHFDAAAGKEELINRRIGRNELDVLKAMRAYVDAQREYASVDRNGNGVLNYAQKIRSSSGKTDGLYWPVELNGVESPLGPLVAEAQGAGYFSKQAQQNTRPQPFHGYYFKILTRQGGHAPGGKYNYVINGNMIGGFAMVAWPAEYGDSGIMTFIVNQQGRVYQKNLGAQTSRIASKMTEYDPDGTWKLSKE